MTDESTTVERSTNPPTGQLRVGIVGGGIGGLALAQGLSRVGIDVSVFERDHSRDARLEGYRIHINPAGSRSLHALLPEASWRDFLTTTGEPDGGFTFLDEHLRILVRVEDDVMYPELHNPVEGHYPVDRTVLRQLLLRGIEDRVHFGRVFTGYEELPDGHVAVHFDDGSTEHCDVLVGADGSESVTRRQLLPDARRIDTGSIAVGLRLPLDSATRQWIPETFQRGMNLILAPVPFFLFTAAFDRQPGAQLDEYVFDERQEYRDYVLCAFVARKDAGPSDLGGMSRSQLKEFVSTTVADWHPSLRRMIDESDEDSAATFIMKAAEQVEPWPTRRVTLLGDALHSMPPVGGLGANAALRDARLLCDQLTEAARERRHLGEALAFYESESRRHGFTSVHAALSTQRQGIAHNRPALAATRAWFRLAHASKPIRRLTFSSAWNAASKKLAWEEC